MRKLVNIAGRAVTARKNAPLMKMNEANGACRQYTEGRQVFDVFNLHP